METKERINLRKILRTVGVLAVVLVAGASWLGISTARYMKGVIRDQFNDEQLALARATAQRVEANIRGAISDSILLNSLPAIQYCDPDAYEILLLSTLPVLNRDNIIEIRRVDREGNTLFVANEQGIGMRHFGLLQQEAGAYLSWASDMGNRGKTMGTGVRQRDPAGGKRVEVMDIIIPTYEDSTDNAHPRPSHRFSGYLRSTLNVSRLLQEMIPPIRSGKTGYGWVLDSSGVFLYHPESSFIGENAFEIRSNRNPAISFHQINQIQREQMLKGGEGTGTYISGWHRDVLEPMEKLIAYSPVRIQGPYLDYVWSVAVVAPLYEIEGVIGMVYTRQILLQGVVVFLILMGCLAALLYELRWSTILEHEVARKTEDISRYASNLERSEAKYRSLVESAEDLIFTLDEDGMIKTANRHMARLFAVPDAELVGQSIYRFLPREQADEQLELIRNVLRYRRSQRTETLFNIQNEDFWFNIQYIPITEEGETHDQILGIARDITDRKSLEKQLINTEKLASLGTLAAGVAHEINNPLGIMLGFCDLLMEKVEPGTMEFNDLKTIERHGLHCKGIVERLLSFARISEEAEDYCDVNENVESILSVVKHTLNMNNIQLAASLSEDLPLVIGDSRGLQQVLLNLINNAIYAMAGDGLLTVLTRPGARSRFVDIVVKDTGGGIKKEFMQKIFDPFFTTKKVGDGTGLGLSVSYGIIANHGGMISVDSVCEEEGYGDCGTTFTISLPVKADISEGEPGPARAPEGN
jgi:two-component system, NtrC family, sensor kinase